MYFDWDKYVLTSDALKSIEDAADFAAHPAGGFAPSTHVVITGHTDTSGTFQYNMRLSERRAKATADQMVADGVSPSVIQWSGKGYTELKVQTPLGVREPENRRAEITVFY